MSFDRIGPYDLTRADLVAAEIIVSFVTSPMSTRVFSVTYVLIWLMMVVAGIVFGLRILSGLAVFLIV